MNIPQTNSKTNDPCPICQEPIYAGKGKDTRRNIGRDIVVTKCNHYFHDECLRKWNQKNDINVRVCTFCRQNPLPITRLAGALSLDPSPGTESPPLLACRTDNVSKLLRELDINPHFADQNFKSPMGIDVKLIHYASEHGSKNCLQILINYGEAEINAKDVDGQTALHITIEKNHHECFRELIAHKKTDLNCKNKLGNTPLHITIEKNLINYFYDLIGSRRVDLNAQNSYKDVPLITAAKIDSYNFVRKRIQNPRPTTLISTAKS